MRACHRLERLHISFDEPRLVADAGLLLPATLAARLGLPELLDRRVDLGDAPGRAHVGRKALSLIAALRAGGDCIDDADALRAGGTAAVLGQAVVAPSTLGTFLRSFRWGQVRQLDAVSREVLARAWAAGAGPGAGALTIDLDSTLCVTYGLAKAGAREVTYQGARGYHPLLAAVPYTPFKRRGGAPLRLLVSRVPARQDAQLRLFPSWAYHACISDRPGDPATLAAAHRRHATVEATIRDLKYGVGLNHFPSGHFGANAAWLAVNVLAHNLARWVGQLGLRTAQRLTTKTLRRRCFSLPGRLTRWARRLSLHLPAAWPWAVAFQAALARLRAIPPPRPA